MEILEIVKKQNGFASFNPMQEKAISSGALEKSMIVSSPTASGKTIVAEIAALNSILNLRKKVVYIAPLRALASEHAHDFKEKYSKGFRIRTVLSTGDFDSSGVYLSNKDIIFSTYEKIASLLNHKAEWLSSLGLLVVDEIHSVGNDRGPALEMLITKLRLLNPKMQVLGLSATIPNAKELAGWLGAELVQSDYRPVKLREGVYLDGMIDFLDSSEEIAQEKDEVSSIASDTLKKGKQALVFVNTRKMSESMARKLAALTAPMLKPSESIALEKASSKVLNALEQPTEQCRSLSTLVRQGACFHNAGLVQKQREVIEELFRKNYLKFICSTPTLCLIPETKIWGGIKEFQANSFSGRENVLALKGNKLGEIRPVEVQKIENTNSIIQIESVSGHAIKLTSNHQILVKRNGVKVLIHAGECKKGDKIATVGKIHADNSSVSYGINKFDYLGADFFYFVGCMLGDGYSGAETSNGAVKFKGSPCIVGRDSETFEYAKGVSTVLGLKYRETQNSYGVPELFLSKEKWFRELLLSCGVDVGEHKFIAESLKLAKKETVAALLQGLFDTDGHVQKLRDVGFSNISIILIKDIQRLLLTFGIVSRLRKRKGSSMSVGEKIYKTKDYYELTIANKKSIVSFCESIGFRIKRKQAALESLVKTIKQNIHFSCCKTCGFRLYNDLFSGRANSHRQWGAQKYQIIKLLGKFGECKSADIRKILGFMCYKKINRLNHHFELIERRRLAKAKYWRLNAIGQYIYQTVILGGKRLSEIISLENCPLCGAALEKKTKNGWREEDFEGDIYWDFVRKISVESSEEYPFVYNVVLPSDGSNDHLFAAEGFLVHNSAGVNLPAFRVIIHSPYRYTGAGMERIPVSEYKQAAGRAGRPKYDTEGEAILISRTEMEKDDYIDYFIKGEVESADSRLSSESQLRFHLLSAIATGFIFDLDSAEKFFSCTFYARQSSGISSLFSRVTSLVSELEAMGFVKSSDRRIDATLLGKRVSELYLDPLSAHRMVTMLRRNNTSDMSYLFTISSSSEFYPLISVPRSKEGELWEKLQEGKGLLPVNVDMEMFSDEGLLQKYWTSLMLNEWVSEVREQELVDLYKVQPGILRAKLQSADWLAYSALELAKLLGLEQHFSPLGRMRRRLKSGIREELIPLCELRGIGRVRARRLFNAGVKGIADVKRADVRDLGRILGEKVAVRVKGQMELKK
ncbi:MAG: DEAD/DEAH box helicase [Candidatus Diapherotrites archaeon]|uniref:DEAD/DEAH box helicase n=1 Tax=Candidatus Iainarchaeum sp. TaxID=3101447 RepID=A0A8T3YLV8_9ARCH|nr:DEAD/DEAH box helicase [Candidatus Diapherotrites archaeon]